LASEQRMEPAGEERGREEGRRGEICRERTALTRREAYLAARRDTYYGQRMRGAGVAFAMVFEECGWRQRAATSANGSSAAVSFRASGHSGQAVNWLSWDGMQNGRGGVFQERCRRFAACQLFAAISVWAPVSQSRARRAGCVSGRGRRARRAVADDAAGCGGKGQDGRDGRAGQRRQDAGERAERGGRRQCG